MTQQSLSGLNHSISDLPQDVIWKIFSCLRGFDLAKSAPLVCSEWSKICLNDKLWRTCYKLEFGIFKMDLGLAGWRAR